MKKVNDEGGIAGRKINYISYDDASLPKAVEMVRRLVEQDQVLLVFQPLGTTATKINTSPTDFYTFEQMQVSRFDGERWGCSAGSTTARRVDVGGGAIDSAADESGTSTCPSMRR